MEYEALYVNMFYSIVFRVFMCDLFYVVDSMQSVGLPDIKTLFLQSASRKTFVVNWSYMDKLHEFSDYACVIIVLSLISF